MDTLTPPVETEVAIVGGGPVGMFLGCLLAKDGIECVVLERRTEPLTHSRAIGIHPPSLEVLDAIGIATELIACGVTISEGQVFYGPKALGKLALSSIGGKYPFVLSVPQTITEAMLERRLHSLAPCALHRGITATDITDTPDGACLHWQGISSGTGTIRARYIIGCDGKSSTIRQLAGIRFPGGAYPDAYLMGDFADDTPFGSEVAFFPSPAGIVESFPLPGGLRRWVARMPEREPIADVARLAQAIEARTGQRIPAVSCRWISAFGIEHYLAERLFQGNIVIAGDAAHVISPIGGQGMNLGFLDVALLARSLRSILRTGKDATTVLSDYDRRRRAEAQVALRRAYFNTMLGRPCPPLDLRHGLIWAILNIPLISRRYAFISTMRDCKV